MRAETYIGYERWRMSMLNWSSFTQHVRARWTHWQLQRAKIRQIELFHQVIKRYLKSHPEYAVVPHADNCLIRGVEPHSHFCLIFEAIDASVVLPLPRIEDDLCLELNRYVRVSSGPTRRLFVTVSPVVGEDES